MIDTYLISEGEFIAMAEDIGKKAKRITTKNPITMTNRRHEQMILDKFWDVCPKCGYTGNFYKMEYSSGIGNKVVLECPKCNHEEDISAYDLW